MAQLTEKQFKSLKDRLQKIGREKLIDRLEGELINANLKGDAKTAAKKEWCISWARNQSGWIINQ